MPKMTELLADLAGGVLLNAARVTEVSSYSPEFVKIELQAEAFCSATWTPGAKLQFRPERGTLGMRTYTPIRWDTVRGATQLIAFTHGEGPAAGWFRRVAAGDTCEVFGPRRSIDLRELPGRAVFVGDESSVGLACALRTVTSDVRHVFEATDPAELTAVLTDLGFVEHCTVVRKNADRARLIRQVRDAAEASAAPFDLVVSGDAATVHALRRDARRWPQPARQVKAKAYWARGRAGLD
jgi:ferric-chelate reductase (NADPH)